MEIKSITVRLSTMERAHVKGLLDAVVGTTLSKDDFLRHINDFLDESFSTGVSHSRREIRRKSKYRAVGDKYIVPADLLSYSREF